MLRLTLVSNGIQLEAARRLRRWEREREIGSGVDLLLLESRRLELTREDRRLWPLRLPVTPPVMMAAALIALVGAVGELRLAHLCNAGRALRLIAARTRRICLLDDGLDQYREHPRAVDPLAFPAGTPCWLFSDAAPFRAGWCRRFVCHELGPLYRRPTTPPAVAAEGLRAAGFATLVIDAPGVERVQLCGVTLPQPVLVVPHPVRSKRSWPAPGEGAETLDEEPPEALLPFFRGLVVVGESMTLLAALRLRPAGTPLLVALPGTADPNLQRLVRQESFRDPAVQVL